MIFFGGRPWPNLSPLAPRKEELILVFTVSSKNSGHSVVKTIKIFFQFQMYHSFSSFVAFRLRYFESRLYFVTLTFKYPTHTDKRLLGLGRFALINKVRHSGLIWPGAFSLDVVTLLSL